MTGRLVALALALAPVSARADKAAAEAAFDAAKQLEAAGKLAEACPKFEVSYNEDPQIGSLLNLADCHEKIGRLATARAEFRSAIELAHRRGDKREQYATARAAALDTRVGYLVVHVPAGAVGIAITLDHRDITAMADSELPIDAGHHVIGASGPRGAWSTELDTADGERRELTIGKLESPAAAAPASVPPPRPSRAGHVDASARRHRHILAGGIGGGGVIALGVGLYFGDRAFSDYDDRSATCRGVASCEMAEIASARRAATASDVLCGAGVAAIAAAAIVWLTAPGERIVVAPVAGGGTVGGSIGFRF